MKNIVNHSGKFITFEGLEGAGKSTVIGLVRDFLAKAGIDYITSRETGGTEIAELIRNILHSHHQEEMVPDAEVLLVFASRAQHLARVIKPALAKGQWVLCDRFTDTTYAYQGAGRGLPEEKIALLETFVQGNLRPDLTFLLDIDPEIGFQRIGTTRELDRFEKSDLDFFKRARANYLMRAKQYATRFRIINAAQSQEQIQRQVETILVELVKP
jgi:dTMP kinase